MLSADPQRDAEEFALKLMRPRGAKTVVYFVWNFMLEFDVFGAVPVRRKYEILDQGRDSLYFQVFPPGHFYFMRGHSLVELTENGNRAQPLLIAFIVHEEEDAARHCQEKREATRLGKLQPHTEA